MLVTFYRECGASDGNADDVAYISMKYNFKQDFALETYFLKVFHVNCESVCVYDIVAMHNSDCVTKHTVLFR